MARATIIGGGIVGLCTAYSLQRRGWDVTVLDPNTNPHGASVVNAGWICPSHCHPVPAPGLTRQSLRWMRQSDSPLFIAPRPDPSLVRWLATFWRHCNERAFAQGTAALAGLNQRTLEIVDEMKRDGVNFEEHRGGILHVYESPSRLEHDLAEFEKLHHMLDLGLSGPYIGNDIRDIEPALSDAVYGGFWLRHDRQVLPSSLLRGLREHIENHGAQIRFGEDARSFEFDRNTVTNVKLNKGRIETDAVVIAAGAWSPAVTRLAGIRVPIQPGKGYSLDYSPSPVHLQHALHVDAARHAITPLNGMTRLAGTMELSGYNERIRVERAEAIIRGAARTLVGWPTSLSVPKIGTGLRPMSADGLPLIGTFKKYRNFAISAGHGMLGLTLAPSSAEGLAELLSTGKRPEMLEPFDPDRF